MLKDTTYQVYCSNLRKYRKNVRETQGKADNPYWAQQVLHMEAKILAGGRALPVEKEEGVPIIPNGVVTPPSNEPPMSREVVMYLKAYRQAVELEDTKAIEKFKTELHKLGYEVQDGGVNTTSNVA